MTYICKTVVIVHVDGKRKEIAPGRPLPEGVDDDALDDLIRLEAIEQEMVPVADLRQPPSPEPEPAPKAEPSPEPEPAPEAEPANPAATKPARKAKGE